MKAKPSNRAVAYLRVSTGQQADSRLGLEAQATMVQAHAARAGYVLAATFTDAGVSGSLPVEERPELAAALRHLRRGDVLLIANRSRLGRDLIGNAVIERTVTRKGARIESAAGEGNDATDEGLFTRQLFDLLNERERRLIASRTRAALKAKRARGERAGAEPFGYRVNGDGRTLHRHDDEQRTLALIHECRAAGFSLRSTAAELNRLGIQTRAGTPWKHQNVAGILSTIARHQ